MSSLTLDEELYEEYSMGKLSSPFATKNESDLKFMRALYPNVVCVRKKMLNINKKLKLAKVLLRVT